MTTHSYQKGYSKNYMNITNKCILYNRLLNKTNQENPLLFSKRVLRKTTWTWQINLYFTTNHLTKQTQRTHYNFEKHTRKLHEHNELNAYIPENYSAKQTRRTNYNVQKRELEKTKWTWQMNLYFRTNYLTKQTKRAQENYKKGYLQNFM